MGETGPNEPLIEDNMPWIRQLVAKEHLESGISVEELLAAGKRGLIKATQSYKKRNHTYQFAPSAELEGGYAIWWVRAELMRLVDRDPDIVE